MVRIVRIMKKSQVLIKENIIVISREKNELKYQFIFLLFAVFAISFPITLSVLSLKDGVGITFRMIALFVVGIGFAYFSFRALLWHTFGKEVLILKKDRIEYFVDYGLFQGGRKELLVDAQDATFGIRINVIEEPEAHVEKMNAEVVLQELAKDTSFNEDNKVVETRLTVSKSDMEKIQDMFFKVYQG